MSLQERYDVIASSINDGSLGFPTSIGVLQKIQKTLDDPSCSIDQATRLILADPLLAARVLKIANSVAYNRSGREISDLRSAVSRLGFSTLRGLCMARLTQLMAGTSSTRIQQQVNQLWEHTAYVASLAHLLARKVTRVDPEAALFAGIIHEIGGFFLLSLADKDPALLDAAHASWVEFGEARIGRAILQQLELPASLLEALEIYWEGYLAIPSVSLGDTLLLAEELAPVASPLRHAKEPNAGSALHAQLDMLIGQEALSDILKEASEEVSSLTAALK